MTDLAPRIENDWPMSRILDLSPLHWKQTLQHEETQRRLAANVFRSASLAQLNPAHHVKQ